MLDGKCDFSAAVYLICVGEVTIMNALRILTLRLEDTCRGGVWTIWRFTSWGSLQVIGSVQSFCPPRFGAFGADQSSLLYCCGGCGDRRKRKRFSDGNSDRRNWSDTVHSPRGSSSGGPSVVSWGHSCVGYTPQRIQSCLRRAKVGLLRVLRKQGLSMENLEKHRTVDARASRLAFEAMLAWNGAKASISVPIEAYG